MKTLLLSMFVVASLVVAENPVEIGTVSWERSHEQALQLAEESGKPVFLLFQEVPGCKGCRDFGKEVLSNPELVNIIETHFVPLVVYNNQGGEHERLRKQYKEPAWNYQVIRFLDAEGKDLIPRKDRIWTLPALSERMVEALEKQKRPVPPELKKLSQAAAEQPAQADTAAPELQTVAFAQHCFWTGERKLGSLEGVHTTEAGFIGHREVTKVTFDPELMSFAELQRQAQSMRCASVSYEQLPDSYRKASERDQKKQIQGTVFSSLELSPEQATKVNAFARTQPRKALEYLSPEQRNSLLSRKQTPRP